MKLAFLGLGVMGFPMAGHLADAGHEVIVYNRTNSKASYWKTIYSGEIATSPMEAALDSEIVLACVGNDNDLKDVTVGDYGAFKSMKKNSIFIDHTTVSASITKELYNSAKESGIFFIDAPISGGQAGAVNGQLSIMCGGDQGAFKRSFEIMKIYSKVCKLMGETGSGQLTKMVNQICIAGLLQGLSEGLNFAKRSDLNIENVVEVISQGAAGSWQMANRHKSMSENKYDFGFAVDWMRKDLNICLDEANRNGSALPITALIDQFYKDVQNNGGGRLDTSSLLKRLESL
jgi:3-hydroxyisobutyrate dehydrogenase